MNFMTQDAIEITGLPAFRDNRIWCIERAGKVVIVDPGCAAPVLEFLEKKARTPLAILLTHHHADHVGGVVGELARDGASYGRPPRGAGG